jgi:hypothetical protein
VLSTTAAIKGSTVNLRLSMILRVMGSDSPFPVARVAAAVKTGDDQEGIGFDEEEERVGELLRAGRWRVVNTMGNCRGFSVMRRTTLSISARKRRPKPGASASYHSCASMSSARGFGEMNRPHYGQRRSSSDLRVSHVTLWERS